jgi:hypothetical protein
MLHGQGPRNHIVQKQDRPHADDRVPNGKPVLFFHIDPLNAMRYRSWLNAALILQLIRQPIGCEN